MPVVRAQAGAVRAEYVALAHKPDRVIERVVLNAFGGDAHHVHVRLHYRARHRLAALGRRLVDNDLSHLIALDIQSVLERPVEEVAAHLFLMVRRTRYLCKFGKLCQHGVKIFHIIHISPPHFAAAVASSIVISP